MLTFAIKMQYGMVHNWGGEKKMKILQILKIWKIYEPFQKL